MPITDEDLLDPNLKPGDPEWEGLLALAGEQAPIAPPQAAPTGQPSPADRMGEVAALFKDQQPEPTGPGNEELEYLANNPEQSKGGNWLGSIASAIAASAGDQGANERFQAGRQHATAAREAGITKARAADQGHRKLDQGSVELLVMGGMSPEAAAKLTYDSPAYKLASSGMGQLAARYRQQDLNAAQHAQSDANKGALQGNRLEASAEQKRLDREAALERLKLAIEAKKKNKGKGGGKANPEADLVGDSGLLASFAGVTPEQAAAHLRGEPVDAPEATLNQLAIGKNLLDGGKLDRNKASLATFNREGGGQQRVETTHDLHETDEPKMMELRNELEHDKSVLTEAITSWKGLSPQAQSALVKFGGIAPSQLMSALKSAGLSDQEQITAARVQRLVNEDIKRLSGSAVSVSEGGRQGTAIGMAAGDFNPWQSPAVLTDYLKHGRSVLQQRWDSANQAYPNLWGKPK